MTNTITYDDLYAHQVQYYTERLAEERAKPFGQKEIMLIIFLDQQLEGIKNYKNERTDENNTINPGYYPTCCGCNSY